MGRPPFLLSVVFASVVLVAASAHAGTLTNASWFQVTEGIPMTRTHAQLGATGTSTATSIAVNLSYPAFASTLFVPKTASGVLSLAVQVTQGGAQAITATPSMGNGSPGIPGNLQIVTATHAGMGVNQSVVNVGNVLLQVPLNVGQAGLFTSTFVISGINHFATVSFYAWTPHTLVFTGLSSAYQPLPDLTAMGSFNLTSMGGGTVTLVSPAKISVDGLISQRRTVTLATLQLSFVPEPGTLLLLGAAGVALAVGGRRRSS